MPGALAELERGQGFISQLVQVVIAPLPLHGVGLLRHDPVDAAGVLVENRLAADISVVPVEDVDAPVRADLDAEADPAWIVGEEKVIPVVTDKS